MGKRATVASAQRVWKIEITYIRSYMRLSVKGKKCKKYKALLISHLIS